MKSGFAILLSCLAILLGACGDDSVDHLGSDKAITALNFSAMGAPGVIDELDHMIAVTVLFGADVTAVALAIEHTGVSLSPASGVVQDFSSPVVYTVTAADGSAQAYVVYVNQGAAVTTAAIAGNPAFTTSISGTSAMGGGTITNQGLSAVTERGLCWNTTGYPTLADAHIADGAGTGSFSNASMMELEPTTTYYVRAYATNVQGTAYGYVMTFHSGRTFGTDHAGGYVFYNDGVGGGLVCAKSDQSSQPWSSVTGVAIGTTGYAIGTGLANSNAIVAQAGHSGSTALVSLNYTDGTYDDWYLPSSSELYLFHTKLRANGVGNIGPYTFFWSSTEASATEAYYLANNGVMYWTGKTSHYTGRAVRAF